MTPSSCLFPVPGIVLGDYPQRRGDAVTAGTRSSVAKITQRRRAKAAGTVGGSGAAQPLHEVRLALAAAGAREAACAQALALGATAAREHLGHEPHAGQLQAARALLEHRLVEMDTGEGKTLAIALAAATAALAGTPVHVVTANDYLAARDAAGLRGFYAALGLTASAVVPGEPRQARRAAYCADVTYATARELAFDYLRDTLSAPRAGVPLERRARRLAGQAAPGDGMLLRGLCMAIVDEADTVLIDEARVPLVLSSAAAMDDDAGLYAGLFALAATLQEGIDYALDRGARRATLSAAGRAHLAGLPTRGSGPAAQRRHHEDLACQALAALHLYQRDRDYVVRDGAVTIVDETTGRSSPGRAWSRGLHQLIELKEGYPPSARATTATQITYQRFFRRYLHLCGISGTLAECAREMRQVYGLPTARVAPRAASRRRALPAALFASDDELVAAIVRRTREEADAGRAVLIGTGSVAESERISRALTRDGLANAVLNARDDRAERDIVEAAGMPGRITVATSMAGRGTDIAVHPAVLARGGLHVILAQHNASPRIDRQFIGRCARRGEPGSFEILRSLESPLMRQHLPARLGHWAAASQRPLFARLAAAWPQWMAERQQRAQRIAMSRADEIATRALAFSGDQP